MKRPISRNAFPGVQKLTCVGTAVLVLGWTGCSSVAPSRTTSGAGTGAAIGGVAGAVAGNNSSMGTATGALGGAAAGAIIGGIVGMVQEAKDRKEQDRLAQERAYQQELARKRSDEAKAKQSMDEELSIAQGFRISDLELADAQKKTDDSSERLKKLRDERSAALARKKSLDDLHEKQLANEAEIARLEEELARLKSETPAIVTGKDLAASPDSSAGPPAKPGL